MRGEFGDLLGDFLGEAGEDGAAFASDGEGGISVVAAVCSAVCEDVVEGSSII